jgi:hypothetical protein
MGNEDDDDFHLYSPENVVLTGTPSHTSDNEIQRVSFYQRQFEVEDDDDENDGHDSDIQGGAV